MMNNGQEKMETYMEKAPILKNRWYLYLTEFFAGMSVMAVELGASRLLAPYFSSSQIVWTIIIGTIMIAMALGNIYGGRSADKNPNPDILYRRILIAAIWIAAIPVVGKYIILGISGLLVVTISTNLLIWAALATCMVIFVFPLFLLGTVTPSLAKYTVESLDESGKVVGALGAYNTIGSIIGTFVPTFISIPAVGTNITFLLFAGILLTLAVVYFTSIRRGRGKIIGGTAIFLVCCILGHTTAFAFWEKDLAYEGESIYNYLQVIDQPQRVVLSTNVLFGVQSVYMKSDKLTGMYYDYAMAAPVMADVMNQEQTDLLVLGMGTGTYGKQCERYYRGMQIQGVEIDEKITELAHQYFQLSKETKVATYDGRAYLNASKEKYDVIMVDAYQDITIPFQMSSVEFFELVKEHLNEGGVMVVNMNMRSTKDHNINQYLSDTIAQVFGTIYTLDVEGNTNRELFASDNKAVKKLMKNNIAKIDNVELKDFLSNAYNQMIPYTGGDLILTDDKAPVELLGMQVIDELIQDELGIYKTKFQKEGLKGLLNSF